jgi:hypothetical protein
MIALLVTWMDAEDRLAGIVIAAEDARTCLAMALSALIGYRSQNLWFLADIETSVLHPTMMSQAVAQRPCPLSVRWRTDISNDQAHDVAAQQT